MGRGRCQRRRREDSAPCRPREKCGSSDEGSEDSESNATSSTRTGSDWSDRTTTSGSDVTDDSDGTTTSGSDETTDGDRTTDNQCRLDQLGNWFVGGRRAADRRRQRTREVGRSSDSVAGGSSTGHGRGCAGDRAKGYRRAAPTRPLSSDDGQPSMIPRGAIPNYKISTPKSQAQERSTPPPPSSPPSPPSAPASSYSSTLDLVLSRHSRTIKSLSDDGTTRVSGSGNSSTKLQPRLVDDLECDNVLRINCGLSTGDWLDVIRAIRGRLVSRDLLFALFVRENEFCRLSRGDRKNLLLRVHPDKRTRICHTDNDDADKLIASRLFLKIHAWYKRYKNEEL